MRWSTKQAGEICAPIGTAVFHVMPCMMLVTRGGRVTRDEAVDQAGGSDVEARIPNVDALGSDSPSRKVSKSLKSVGE